MIENMAIQLTDERRRWGAVKEVNGDSRKPMDLLDPLHISLMVETLHMLQQNKAYGAVQLQATVEIENLLTDAMNDTSGNSTLYVPIPRGADRQRKLEIVADHEAWLRNNLGVSTSYNQIG